MAVGTVSYLRVRTRVLAALNALDPDTYGDAAEIDENDRRRIAGEVRDAIKAYDLRVAVACCARVDGPHRARFTEWSSELSSGDELPESYGPLGSVMIKPSSAGSFEEAEEVDKLEKIRQWRANTGGVFGSINHDQAGSALAGFYCIVGRRVHFTGYRFRVELCTSAVAMDASDDDEVIQLLSPEGFEDLIVAGSVMGCLKEGDDWAQAEQRYGLYAAEMLPLVVGGAEFLPPNKQE